MDRFNPKITWRAFRLNTNFSLCLENHDGSKICSGSCQPGSNRFRKLGLAVFVATVAKTCNHYYRIHVV